MIAEFIEPKDPRWMRALQNTRHDYYHLPEYVKLAAEYEGGIPVAFYAEDKGIVFLAPLLIRKLPDGLNTPDDWYDAATSYGYPTPVMSPGGTASDLQHFLRHFKQCGQERGIVSTFFRLHPLLTLPQSALAEHGETVCHGTIVYFDLSLSTEEIWAQIRTNHKRDLKKLNSNGFRISVDEWDRFHEFTALYAASMERVDARESFRFSESYFNDLRSSLGDRLKLHAVISPNGEMASASLGVVTDGIMQNYLVGSSNAYLKQAPSKLVYDFSWRWAKEHGCRFLFLGGGLGGESGSLMQFKIGFSKLLAPFYTYRMILDDHKYATLMRSWKAQHKDVVDDDRTFFPGYRRQAGSSYERLVESSNPVEKRVSLGG